MFTILPGCANPPTPTDIEAEFNIARQVINESHAAMVQGCRSDFAEGTPERNSCIRDANLWRQAAMTEALNARSNAYNENWRAARDSRKRLEEKLQDVLPNWPQIKDLITIIDNGTVQGIATPGGLRYVAADIGTNNGVGGEIPVPIQLQAYAFSGQIQFDWGSTTVAAPFAGTLEFQGSRIGSAYSGVVRSGTLEATFPGGVQARLVVVKQPSNTISTSGSGDGQMVFLAEFEHDMESWESILFSRYRILVPITMDAQGIITIDTTSDEVAAMLPYAPRPYTDYNLDGVYDYQSDFGAFMSDFASQSVATDINYDGLWNQSDIDQWISEFDADAANMNP